MTDEQLAALAGNYRSAWVEVQELRVIRNELEDEMVRLEADRDRWKAEAMAAREQIEPRRVNMGIVYVSKLETTEEQDRTYAAARAANEGRE